ncbi:MAG: hypothetical protein HY277_02000 [Ignavibacteriales bacterium]|nr:hypothetical protein [Ignavibacteriales bacterium]
MTRFAFAALDMIFQHFPVPRLAGATVVEVGPGDAVALGIPLLALGAASYYAIDPFMGNVNSHNARRLYQRVAEELPKRYAIHANVVPSPETFPKAHECRSVFLYREGIEDYPSFGLSEKADLVFSHGVGAQVAYVQSFALASYEFLKPGGIAIHRVDFGPVGCWRRHKNPLTFLAVAEKAWQFANSHRGLSNRVRFHELLGLFQDVGFQVTVEIRERFRREDVLEVYPHLPTRLKISPIESLEVACADFVCVKPPNAATGNGRNSSPISCVVEHSPA